MSDPPKHPAKFSKEILNHIDEICESYEIYSLIDPFGGVGTIFNTCPNFIVSNEIEMEWARQGKQDFSWHGTSVVNGDALNLPFKDNAFRAAATSPTYANRMADSHNAQEKCRACNGSGWDIQKINGTECSRCNGAGYNKYKRMTYTHQLGRDLNPNNTGAMQWGTRYQMFHEHAWREVTRVVREFFILNVSDHIRNKEVVPVCDFHVGVLTSIGWTLVEEHPIATSRMKMGQNYEARVDHEMIYVFRKDDPLSTS